MTLNNAYNQYKENSVYTASPEELTLMLYNGLIKFLMQAQLAIDEKDIQKANTSIIRSQDIIFEFQSTLDMTYEISHNLALMYEYMNRRLIQANIKKDKEIVEEVLGYARELRDTWQQAMKIAKQQQGGARQVAK
ncbi:MAG: flagellar export chaperone FliS [Clostridia bacterium]|nr:flagellar export chaperone FliS [Clostridia bacterium]